MSFWVSLRNGIVIIQGKCCSEELQGSMGSIKESGKWISRNDITFLFHCYGLLSCFHNLCITEDHFQWFIMKEFTLMLKRYHLFLSSTPCSVDYVVQKHLLSLGVTKVGAIHTSGFWELEWLFKIGQADRLLWKHYKIPILSVEKRTILNHYKHKDKWLWCCWLGNPNFLYLVLCKSIYTLCT